jgi:hypothetical protein
VTPEERKRRNTDMVRDAKDGVSESVIAERYSLSPHRTREILRDNGVTSRS